ncbi:MAG: hypothetical protein ACLVIY_10870 [Anaerobutyricum soehngenii]
MKKTKLRLLLLLFFIGGLIILPQKAKAAEIIPVNISVRIRTDGSSNHS